MRRCCTLLSLFVSLLFAATAHAGQGVNLRWNNCIGDAGLANRNFACNANVGNNMLVGSFELGQDILQSSGQEIVIDLVAGAATLPAWWSFRNAGTCRPTSLSMNTVANPAAVNCTDWASGAAVGGIGAYNIGQRGPNTARIVMALAVPGTSLVDLFSATEYFSFNLVINNAKTVGTGACAGCSTPVCIVFLAIKCTTQVAANDRTITGPTNNTDSHIVTWQGPTSCFPVPTSKRTWSEVKSLYR